MGYFKPATILSYKEFLNSKTKIGNTECKTASGIVCIGLKHLLPATIITCSIHCTTKVIHLLEALGILLFFSLGVKETFNLSKTKLWKSKLF